jgi:shikimate dehydrogenase
MKGFPRTSVLPKKVSSHALAFDLVYRPEETPFLKDARKRGLRIVGGLDMLVWQALAAWEIWVGPVDDPHALKSQLAIHLRSILRKEKKG